MRGIEAAEKSLQILVETYIRRIVGIEYVIEAVVIQVEILAIKYSVEDGVIECRQDGNLFCGTAEGADDGEDDLAAACHVI